MVQDLRDHTLEATAEWNPNVQEHKVIQVRFNGVFVRLLARHVKKIFLLNANGIRSKIELLSVSLIPFTALFKSGQNVFNTWKYVTANSQLPICRVKYSESPVAENDLTRCIAS